MICVKNTLPLGNLALVVVILIDPCVDVAKAEFFTKANQIVCGLSCKLHGDILLDLIDIVLVLIHNIKFDAATLELVQISRISM